jgi:CRP-like cAMP-binding protein
VVISIQTARPLPNTGPLGRAAAEAGPSPPRPGSIERMFDLASASIGSISVPRNRTLVREGDRADTIFLVQSGILRSSKLLPDGRRQVVSFHEEGALVGLLEGEVHIYSLEGATTVRLKPANRLRLRRVLDEQSEWRDHVLKWAARELAEARHLAVMLGRQNAHERVCSFLLNRARDGGVAELRMSRKDMADYLGLTAETVSRLLTRLESDGLIRRISARRIEIADPSGLAVRPEQPFATRISRKP